MRPPSTPNKDLAQWLLSKSYSGDRVRNCIETGPFDVDRGQVSVEDSKHVLGAHVGRSCCARCCVQLNLADLSNRDRKSNIPVIKAFIVKSDVIGHLDGLTTGFNRK